MLHSGMILNIENPAKACYYIDTERETTKKITIKNSIKK